MRNGEAAKGEENQFWEGDYRMGGRKKWVWLAVVTAVVMCMASCSGRVASIEGDTSANPPADRSKQAMKSEIPMGTATQPLKLSLLTNIPVDLFETTIQQPVKNRFPNVELSHVPLDMKKLSDLIASGEIPDLMYFPDGNLQTVMDYGLLEDLAPFMKKENFDLGKLNDDVRNYVSNFSNDGSIRFIPGTLTKSALLYNKALFDQFAVDYPRDNMTWDEVIALASRMTRTQGDVQYHGLSLYYGPYIRYNQLSPPLIDLKAGKAAINNESNRQWISTIGSAFHIPGNEMTSKTDYRGMFVKGILAMYADTNFVSYLGKPGLNWDMVTAPTFKERPGVGIQLTFFAYGMTSVSKHKGESFQVLSYLMSDEGQLASNRLGRLTALKNPEVLAQFAQGLEGAKEKNLAAYYKLTAAPRQPVSVYDDAANAAVIQAFQRFMYGETDVNTALRDAEEQANKAIGELKSAK
jgi:multiple sugar transport system substrate-binding protein